MRDALKTAHKSDKGEQAAEANYHLGFSSI